MADSVRQYDIDSLDNRDPAFMERFLELVGPALDAWFRPTVRGIHRVPEGAGLYVANHNAGLLTPDTYILGGALYRALGMDAVPYGLGHEVAIRWPIAHQLLVPLGAVRASHENAHRLFAADRKVLVYPGGDLDAMRSFRDRNRIRFGPRRGYIRLALREAVPIIPVVTAGAHATSVILTDGQWLARALRFDRLFRLKVCPVTLSVPWGITIGPTPPHLPYPTRIDIEILAPIYFDRTGEDAASDDAYVEQCHTRVHHIMQRTLTRLAHDRRRGTRHPWAGLAGPR